MSTLTEPAGHEHRRITATEIVMTASPPITVGGEATGTPGLAVTPAVTADGAYDGGWTVTHTRSGNRVVAVPATTLARARELAALLATVDGWTRPAGEITADAAMAAHVRTVSLRHFDTHPGRPLWWARWSWHQLQPRWVVCYVDEFGDRVGWTRHTWPQLVAVLDDGRDGDRYGEPVHAYYDPRPLWSLCCAAPLCLLPNLLGDDEEPCYSPEPVELAATALDHGWHRPEPGRWLCPDCVADHHDQKWWR